MYPTIKPRWWIQRRSWMHSSSWKPTPTPIKLCIIQHVQHFDDIRIEDEIDEKIESWGWILLNIDYRGEFDWLRYDAEETRFDPTELSFYLTEATLQLQLPATRYPLHAIVVAFVQEMIYIVARYMKARHAMRLCCYLLLLLYCVMPYMKIRYARSGAAKEPPLLRCRRVIAFGFATRLPRHYYYADALSLLPPCHTLFSCYFSCRLLMARCAVATRL